MSIPIGSIPIGSIPIGSIPIGSIPIGSIPIWSTLIGSIPIGFILYRSIRSTYTGVYTQSIPIRYFHLHLILLTNYRPIYSYLRVTAAHVQNGRILRSSHQAPHLDVCTGLRNADERRLESEGGSRDRVGKQTVDYGGGGRTTEKWEDRAEI